MFSRGLSFMNISDKLRLSSYMSVLKAIFVKLTNIASEDNLPREHTYYIIYVYTLHTHKLVRDVHPSLNSVLRSRHLLFWGSSSAAAP